ncbi:MAG TPA: alkaline phosphatase family protein [Candidatus Acidoferrales bacterium]|jgi:phospholipase C|nr:alkaline phosphatase family protein [Candidatus Acidoferrales bacterium]
MITRLASVALAAVVLTNCSGSTQSGGPTGALPAAAMPAAGQPVGNYIKHLVIIVQENRSFDNVFYGFPGEDTPAFGNMLTSRDPHASVVKVRLRAVPFGKQDECHGYVCGLLDYDHGKMDGFGLPLLNPGEPAGRRPYTYLPRVQVAPYWAMAKQYVLADRMFSTQFDASFVAHLDLIASTSSVASAASIVGLPTAVPWGCGAPVGTKTSLLRPGRLISNDGPFPCFTQFATLADTLDAAGLTWKYYAPAAGTPGALWSIFQSIDRIYHGPEYEENVISPQTRVLQDAAAGNLPSVSWVVPDSADSDHAGISTNRGPSWVASVVNAIGTGPQWNSTAIVILWDDWGGWYDHVVPPQRDFRGLGIRVPCIIVSPYARKGYISHTVYEFGSVLHFAEQAFNLPSLGPNRLGGAPNDRGYTDVRGASFADAFDFTQKPRSFTPIPQPFPIDAFRNEKPSGVAPDDI